MKGAGALGLAAACWLSAPQVTLSEPLSASANQSDAVARASAAFALPPSLIARVIRVESAGDPRALSRAGAMGLMQLMPATWADLRARLGLGPDPFDIADNVFAGAAYLREMLDRFGAPGFLAAYNAGPGRYAEILAGRAAMPAETRIYLSRFETSSARTTPAPGGLAGAASGRRTAWRNAGFAPRARGLFVLREGGKP